MRKIIHIDMDAFYASVEQRDDKSLRGRPVAVGHDGERGIVSTASYEARRFGIHSAMSMQKAKQLCKELVIVEPHYERYKEVSMIIRSLMYEYTDIIEPISLDEAFLDVTENKKGEVLAVNIAKELKARILWETFLTSSAGVSYNKFLAKIASDWNKPDGLKVIHPKQAQTFIDNLPIEKMWGVGKKTLEKMHSLGIYNGRQLREMSHFSLVRNFGKTGEVFYNYARGIDDSEVVSDWERKSVSCEHTLEKDITEKASVLVELYNVVLDLCRRIEKSDFKGRCLTLKIKYNDFTVQTKSMTRDVILDDKEVILPLAKQLVHDVNYKRKPIRLIGLGVSQEVKAETYATLPLKW